MENGKIKVWLPAIRAGSGTDVFTCRLATALEHHGMTAHIDWFPLSRELLPSLLLQVQPPTGTDIIIANSWNAFAFRRAGLPLVAVVHHCSFDSAFESYKGRLQALYHRFIAAPREARSLQSADAVVAVSHYVARHLRDRLNIGDAEVIHNWVDTEIFSPSPQQARAEGPFRLLFVGKPTRLKGGDLLIPLMQRLGAGFELRIAAHPQDCRGITAAHNIILFGKLTQQEMVQAYRECDALLLPSRTEGFGYAALEAMACGRPVIASNSAALPEIVADAVTGILCREGDWEVFADACRKLASDAVICSTLGGAGRQRAVEVFGAKVVSMHYVELIKRIIGTG